MAQGGGRGWFHRKRPQPSPDESIGTTHSKSAPLTRPEVPVGAPQQLQSEPVAEPQHFAEWSPEARSTGTYVRVEADTAAQHHPSEEPSSSTEGTVAHTVTRDGSAVDAAQSAITEAPASDSVPVAPAPHHAPVAPALEERAARGIDWDAATAAALTADADPAGVAPEHHSMGPDRLLEDLIREIVGDATADTASALHPMRSPVETAAPAPSAPAHEAPDENVVDATTETPGDSVTSPSVAAPQSSAPERSAPERSVPESSAPQTSAPMMQHTAVEAMPALAKQTSQPMAPAPAESALSVADPIAEAVSPTARPVADESPHAPTEAPDVSRETSIDHGGTPLAYELADETRRRTALDEAVLPLPPSTRVLTISNQKGGVGKTTTAVNLAAGLARAGARVLVIDLDPQGNASTALGVDHRSERKSVYEVLVSDVSLAEVVQPSTEHELLDCVPATIHLAGAEIELVSLVAREQRLRRALDAHLASMDRPYDYVFIDCPPSLGLLTINAFVAAREVLIPIQCEYYALEGLSQLLSNIELIEKHLNPELRLSTILLTMYDSRTNLAQQVAQEVRDHFPVQTLETIIPRSVRVSEAPSYGQSVISYDFGSTGSLSYREAAAEIARRGAATPEESN